MKFKKIMLVSILLLAIFTIGAVSAAEDADTAAADEVTEEPLSSPVDEVELESTDEADSLAVSEDDIEIDGFPEEVKYGESLKFNITVHDADNNGGHVEGYLDDHDYGEYWDYYSANESFSASIGQSLSFGTHKLSLRFVDDNGNYDITKVFTFNVTDYEPGIYNSGTNPVFGDDYYLEFILPSIAGELTVNINNKEYKKFFDEFSSHYIYIQAADIRYGINNLDITFNPDESKYKSKSAQATINCTAEIRFTYESDEYGNVGNITLVLPSNATGNLTVKLNGNQAANIPLVDGKALFDFNTVAPGEYSIEVAYTGDDYEAMYNGNDMFEVVPNVKVPDYVYTGYEYFNITITLPDTPGKLVITSEGDASYIYSNDSACGVMTVSLPVVSQIINDVLHVNYTLGDYNCEKTYNFEYSDINPNFELLFSAYESSALKGDDFYISWEGDYWFTPELTGKFIIYVDNVRFDTLNEVGGVSINTENLTVGEHTWKIEFVGDEYYMSDSSTGSFNVTYINIYIPDEVTYGSDYVSSNSIHVYMPENATGMVVVYVDNKEFKTEFITSGSAHISLTDLTLGKHDVEVRYSGNYPAYSKKGNVTSDYIFWVCTDYNPGIPYLYGEPINVYVRLAKANATVNVEFEGKTYSVKVEDGFGSIKLPTLPEGTYKVKASFAGDSTFPAKTDNCTFEVNGYAVFYPDTIKFGSDENITLTLPENATGNLSVIINDNTFANVPLKNGIAVISLKNLTYGHHSLKIIYTGEDYAVQEISDEIYVTVNWEYDSYIYLSEKGYIYMEIPKNATGNVILTSDDGDEIPLTPNEDGIINCTLPNLKLGSHSFKLSYNGTDYDMIFESWADEFYYSVELNMSVVDDEGVLLTLPEDANGKLTILYANEGHEPDKVLFDGNVTGPNVKIPFTGLKPGSYELFINYEDDKYGTTKEYPYAYISKPTPEITISTSGDDKKTVITFGIENATGSLIVKIDDGASQLVSMNNGVGSLTIENIAAGNHTITVSYSGDSNFDSFSVEKTFDVEKSNSESIIPPRIVAGNAAVYYSAGSIYKVTVYAKGGKLAANTLVVIKINGKKVATVRTNANGVATYKLVQNPGKYKITTEALGASVTRTLSVKHVVVLRAVAVKKSARQLLLQATVKIGKKAVAKKWVVFKFNGRTIKAKTNKYGVAKVVIKKPILNRLKVGKNVVYQATYLKDTVKRVAKIYK